MSRTTIALVALAAAACGSASTARVHGAPTLPADLGHVLVCVRPESPAAFLGLAEGLRADIRRVRAALSASEESVEGEACRRAWAWKSRVFPVDCARNLNRCATRVPRTIDGKPTRLPEPDLAALVFVELTGPYVARQVGMPPVPDIHTEAVRPPARRPTAQESDDELDTYTFPTPEKSGLGQGLLTWRNGAATCRMLVNNEEVEQPCAPVDGGLPAPKPVVGAEVMVVDPYRPAVTAAVTLADMPLEKAETTIEAFVRRSFAPVRPRMAAAGP